MELRLYVDPDAPLIFVEPNAPPADNPNARPWLTFVSDKTVKARVGAYKGTFSNLNASISVQLKNDKGQGGERNVIGRPLRVRATVFDGTLLYFDGTVQSADYGTVVTMGIET